MKKIFRTVAIQLSVFLLLIVSVEIFCYFQIINGHLFHFEAVVDSTFYLSKNTRELSPSPSSVKYGVFPAPPQADASQIGLKPLQFSFTYRPQVTRNPSYGKIDGLPFFIQTKTERFRHNDDTYGFIYDVEYGIDEKYRRISTVPQNAEARKKFLILAGCSYTFGAGLENDHTLPSVINQKSKDLVAYNYGMRGASPGDVLLRLRSINKPVDIPQKSGTVIYVYIDDHMSRLVSDINVIGTWGAKSSYYNYGLTGDVTYQGTYEDVFPIKTWLLQTFFSTSFGKYFFLGTYNSVTARDFENLSNVIEQMQTTAFKKLNAEHFYVLLYPATYSSRYLALFLEKKGIPYIDYTNWNMFQITNGHSIINYDGHPTYESNLVLGNSLINILEK